MPGLGIGILFMGYWVAYYGITQIQGGNWGFLDLGIPSRWTAAVAATARDNGTSAPAPDQYTGGVTAVKATGVPANAAPSPAFVQPPSPIK
jgi:hypothetical protein